MMINSTFSTYISRQFLFWFASVLLALLALILLFDTVELLRRTSSETDTNLTIVMAMALFKLPHMAQKILPFAILFGGMMAFWRLNRHHELVVARAAGVSVWQFACPVLFWAFVIGALKITVFSPFSSAMLLRYEQLEAQHVRGKASLAAVSSEGLWLRQRTDGGHYILHADEIEPRKMELRKVTVFHFRGTDEFTLRVDAGSARLQPGHWHLEAALITGPDKLPVTRANYDLATDLTPENIQDSFATPETLSFWALPAFIGVLERAGFSGLRHRLYWHSLLADPLLLLAMALLAATFTTQPLRRGGTSVILATGVAASFILFFTSDVVFALGLSARIPVLLAAWSPAVIASLIATAMLFHLEDG